MPVLHAHLSKHYHSSSEHQKPSFQAYYQCCLMPLVQQCRTCARAKACVLPLLLALAAALAITAAVAAAFCAAALAKDSATASACPLPAWSTLASATAVASVDPEPLFPASAIAEAAASALALLKLSWIFLRSSSAGVVPRWQQFEQWQQWQQRQGQVEFKCFAQQPQSLCGHACASVVIFPLCNKAAGDLI